MYHPLFTGLDRVSSPGTNILQAQHATRLAGSRIEAGGFVVVRQSTARDLSSAVRAVEAAGAQGVAFFRLPDQNSADGPSLAHILALATGQAPVPCPTLRWEAGTNSGRLVLVNDSDADLPPRLDGPNAATRGYRLEVRSPRAFVWREALAGDFHSLAATTAEGGARVAIPLAERLTFCFSGLPAHASLATGLVQLAPDADPAALRYRLPDLAASTDPSAWQPLR